ncbi:MAG: PocR ligand-binding domain-containing protein [Anaerolineaceae bacterium]|nr:PocR ligand-binding domain-containing protein [Anaerolineaceae bacterium]
MSDKLLTTKEVEHLVQLNRVTIYRLIRDAGFPALKVGGQWRFPRQEIEDWLANHGRPVEAEPSAEPPPLKPFAEATRPPELTPNDMLSSIEIVSLLKAFSVTVELSILVVDMEGETLVKCPGYQHPFCQFVHRIDPVQDRCLAIHQLQANLARTTRSLSLVDCIPGLHYLQTPIWIEQLQVGYILMGPLITDDVHPAQVQQALTNCARQYGADSRLLLEQFQTVKRFSNDQVHMLTDLLSRVVSTMLEIVYRSANAVQRLNTIARLASEM